MWRQDKPLWLATTGTPLTIRSPFLIGCLEKQAAALIAFSEYRPTSYVTILLLLVIASVGIVHAAWSTFPAGVSSRFEEEFDFSNKADTISVRKRSLPRSCPSKPLAGQLVGELQLLLLQRDNLYSAWITDLQDGSGNCGRADPGSGLGRYVAHC